MLKSMMVAPGTKARLGKRDPAETFGWDKKEAKKELAEVTARLDELQNRLAAESKRSVLVVLQALDAAGKDGTIRSIFTGVNPSGVRVHSFKAPAGEELAHDYLWRIHAVAPGKGEIGIFNRSHYEDVLVVRVRKFVPVARWRKRFQHIREFERMLSDEGTTVVKIHLHISPEAQRKRLQDRIDTVEKRWKFNAGDLEDRKLWPEYMKAYEDVFAETSTEWAPWYIVPSDHNWVRNLCIAKLLVSVLEEMDPKLPPGAPNIESIIVE